jgi:hypothetical protein
MKLKDLLESTEDQTRIATGIQYMEKRDLLTVTDPGAGALPLNEHLRVNGDGKLVVDPGSRSLLFIIKLNSQPNIINEEIRGDDWLIKEHAGTVGISFYNGVGMDETWLPNVKEYAFGDCELTSLKLDPHRFSNLTHLRFINGTKIHGGLMSFLTLPKLQSVTANRFLEDERLFKALEIVNKHLEHRDVPECMDELMEAGLKEYAKR